MRTLLLELRPGGLTDANLGDLLRQLSEAVTGQEGIPVELSITNCNQNLNQAPQLPPDVHIGLYRIAQEALNNVVKHARASKVTVSLQCQAADNGRDAQTVTLRVQDDGRGFDPTTIPAGRLGLQIMQERVHKLVAELTLESQPGAGTRITVVWNQQQGEHNE
jgi:signal transduction histidine kinase